MNTVSETSLDQSIKNIKWYRVPIENSELKELSKRSNIKGAFQSLTHLTIWILTGLFTFYLFKNEYWYLFVISLLTHGLVGSHFSNAHHELSHGTVFKNKALNNLFLQIFCLLGWLNYHIYKMSHTYHHRYTCFTELDNEVVLPREPSLRFFFLLQLFSINLFSKKGGLFPTIINFVKIAFNRFDNPLSMWTEDLFRNKHKERNQAKIWARIVLLFHINIFLLSTFYGEFIIVLLVSCHTFIGRWHHYLLNETQHNGLQKNISDFRKCSRSFSLNPISEFLYWHMNWHTEHHMYAAVPVYNLKKLHNKISYGMPKPRTLISSWKEMRQTFKSRVNDFEYAFDTNVPPREISIKNNGHNKEIFSIGDLAPESIR